MIHAYNTGLRHTATGQNSGFAKLTNEQARKIREEYIPRDKNSSTRALARKYKVSQTTISYILLNKTYKD